MRVFVTGGSGYVGRAVLAALRARGDDAVVLSRNASRARSALGDGVEIIEGDPTCQGPWQAQVSGCDAVINLAGEPVAARRWNAQVRQVLHDSRVDATREVVQAIAAAPAERRPRVLVNASGVDYYAFEVDVGRGGDDLPPDEVAESAPAGSSFLARVCRDWEAEALEAEKLAVRVVMMRTGLVLGGRGGPLDRWVRAFRWFAGGKLGSGRQWMSWVHLDDVVGGYLFALDTAALSGPVNLVAPSLVRNADFARALGTSVGRPALIPAPAPMIRLAVGDFADYLLHGRAVVPRALTRAHYAFRHGSLLEALQSR
jgi:uncharacterized protein (TIGR01777 family)